MLRPKAEEVWQAGEGEQLRGEGHSRRPLSTGRCNWTRSKSRRSGGKRQPMRDNGIYLDVPTQAATPARAISLLSDTICATEEPKYISVACGENDTGSPHPNKDTNIELAPLPR